MNDSSISKSPTPLWVISIFVSLTEVVTGIAVTQAKEGVQIALTVFVIAFPTLIALAFFLTLWKKNYVFWPPSEFGGGVDVSRYVEAMQRRNLDQSRIHEILREAVHSAFIPTQDAIIQGLGATKQEVKRAVDQLTQVALARVDESIISIDTATLAGSSGERLAIPYDADRPVHLLLDDIWFSLMGVVKAFSYGKSWVIRDTLTKKVFDVGRPWAKQNGFREDKRSLKEVGITPGMQLEVVSPKVN